MKTKRHCLFCIHTKKRPSPQSKCRELGKKSTKNDFDSKLTTTLRPNVNLPMLMDSSSPMFFTNYYVTMDRTDGGVRFALQKIDFQYIHRMVSSKKSTQIHNH